MGHVNSQRGGDSSARDKVNVTEENNCVVLHMSKQVVLIPAPPSASARPYCSGVVYDLAAQAGRGPQTTHCAATTGTVRLCAAVIRLQSFDLLLTATCMWQQAVPLSLGRWDGVLPLDCDGQPACRLSMGCWLAAYEPPRARASAAVPRMADQQPIGGQSTSLPVG